MRMKYISQIQLNIRKYGAIHTNRVTFRLLDGSYNSIYKGRSMNFEELREYVVGDEVKDIDWKASSRSQRILVRQYIAEKKHNIMLVMDSNRRMLANLDEEHEKREAAIMSAGTLAYLVNQNGDYVSAMYGTEIALEHFPFKTGLMNIELILENYHNAVTEKNNSELDKTLSYISRNFRQRMIIVIVTDLEGIQRISDINLKRLLVIHDVLLLNMSDAGISGKNVYDIGREEYVPEFFTRDKHLAAIEKQRRRELTAAAGARLGRLGVSMVTIDALDNLDSRVVELLERHKNEKRK